jgi:hypothetical protein
LTADEHEAVMELRRFGHAISLAYRLLRALSGTKMPKAKG